MLQNRSTSFNSLLEPLEGRILFAGTPLEVTQVGYMGGTQLKITGSSAADRIKVKSTGSGLLVSNTGGWSTTVAGAFKSLLIDGGAGNDSITIDASVTAEAVIYGSAGNDTLYGGSGNDRMYGGDGTDSLYGGAGKDVLVTVGGGSRDVCVGGLGDDSFWTDGTEKIHDLSAVESKGGAVHRVNGFQSYTFASSKRPTTAAISKELVGQTLADPITTSTAYTYRSFANLPLFSSAGPSADDVWQGAVGDCYFLATLSSIAKVSPNVIRQSIADLGDGTYAVQFMNGSTPTFVRVDSDLPTYSSGVLAYADLGAQNSMWVAIMEKAYTFFRSNAGTYASINSGWMDEVYTALGKKSTSNYASSNATWLTRTIQQALGGGQSVTFAVSKPKDAPLIGGHAYAVDSVVTDKSGNVTGIKLRNPWGVDGAGNDGLDDGYVTITPAQAQAAFLGLTSGVV